MASQTNALKVTLPSDTEIRLERSFNAPRRLVWDAMTKPDYLRQWWGPRGSTLTRCELDLQPGGEWHFTERGADGTEHPFRGVFKEIEPIERMVWTFIYDVPPFDQFESVETLVLTEQDGRTTLTAVSKHGSKEARDGHVNSGMEKGAAESYDRLEELLGTMA